MSVRSQFDDVVIDQAGNALSNVQVSVYSAGTQTLANIYNLRSGGTTTTNPFLTNSTGLVQFWAEPGSYDITWVDQDDPQRINDRTFTWEAVSGATAGITASQLASPIPSTKLTVPSCSVRKSAGQSLTDGTNTAITWDIEVWDNDGIHDNVTNNTRLTCKTPGVYSITFNGGFQANATAGRRNMWFRINGSSANDCGFQTDVDEADSFWGWEKTTNIQYKLAINDYVQAYMMQDTNSTLSTHSEEIMRFSMTWISEG